MRTTDKGPTGPASERLLHAAAAAIFVAVLAALLALAPVVEGKVRFKIVGKGYGHGVGMSQWGAYGYAKEGRSHEQILRRYYQGTKLGEAPTESINVLLSVRSDGVAFSGARKACGRSLDPGKAYRAALAGGGSEVKLESAGGEKLNNCGKRLKAKPKGRITVAGDGVYRGKLIARAGSAGLNVINRVGLEGYLKGVVPNEVPASWPAAALRAQAVAARSYALATAVDGEGFDAYDDTRSQVYAGVETEMAATSKAVAKTAGDVVTYKGEAIPAFFFSTSGGRTENAEYGFSGGSPKPYLVSVRDPFDDFSPVHSWKLTYNKAKMTKLLGAMLEGKLKDVKVTKTGVSPRIVRAKIVGSGGTTTVSGPELRAALELRSTWATFEKKG